MGVDAGDFYNSGSDGIVIPNFDNEMIALYQPTGTGAYGDVAEKTGIGLASRNSLGFGCLFFDADLDGRQQAPHHWLLVKLDGRKSNRDTGSYRSCAHFGLGADSVVNAIEIRWPSRMVQQLSNVAGDRNIQEAESGRRKVWGQTFQSAPTNVTELLPLYRVLLVERQIQLQHVHARFAENAQIG